MLPSEVVAFNIEAALRRLECCYVEAPTDELPDGEVGRAPCATVGASSFLTFPLLLFVGNVGMQKTLGILVGESLVGDAPAPDGQVGRAFSVLPPSLELGEVPFPTFPSLLFVGNVGMQQIRFYKAQLLRKALPIRPRLALSPELGLQFAVGSV